MPPRPRQAAALLTAAALGFGASQVLTQRSSAEPDRSGQEVLSLEVSRPDDSPSVENRPDGGLSVSLPVLLRNSGPRPVVLRSVELAGTSLQDDTVAGRTVPSGSTSRLVLRRPVDCARAPSDPTALPGPLTVTATTPAGERQVGLRLDDAARFIEELARRACGQVPPGQALELEMTSARVDNGVGRLGFEVRNGSAQPLQVRDVVPANGLRVRLLDMSTGTEIELPLDVPAGGYDEPGQSAGTPPLLRLTAVLVIDDCGSPLPGSAFVGGPAFQLVIASVGERPASGGEGSARQTETAGFGDAGSLIAEMEAETCP